MMNMVRTLDRQKSMKFLKSIGTMDVLDPMGLGPIRMDPEQSMQGILLLALAVNGKR